MGIPPTVFVGTNLGEDEKEDDVCVATLYATHICKFMSRRFSQRKLKKDYWKLIVHHNTCASSATRDRDVDEAIANYLDICNRSVSA